MSPYPAAWFELADADGKAVAIKVYEVAKEFCNHNVETGTLLTDGKSYMKVAVEGGYVALLDVQLAGKKRMPVADLLRGFDIKDMKIND
jgi:methionyl-tRNA formyltransferase